MLFKLHRCLLGHRVSNICPLMQSAAGVMARSCCSIDLAIGVLIYRELLSIHVFDVDEKRAAYNGIGSKKLKVANAISSPIRLG